MAGGDDGTGHSSATGDSAPDPFASIFDDSFIAGARYSEPTAKERERDRHDEVRRMRQRRRASRRAGWRGRSRRAVPWLVLAAIAVGLVGINELRSSGDDDSAAEPLVLALDHIEVVYAHPNDVAPDPDAVRATQHEAAVAIAWLEEQRGAPLQVARDGDDPAIRTVELSQPSGYYVGSPAEAFLAVWIDVLPPDAETTMFLVFADVQIEGDEQSGTHCGDGDYGATIVWLGNCPADAPALDSEWGDGTTITVARELLHGMGAPPACAPHVTIGGGHVYDSPADILYESADADASASEIGPDDLRIDVGRDDYLEHGIAGCPDIADSRVWGEPE